MAVAPCPPAPPTSTPVVVFFGLVPTPWSSLTDSQKLACLKPPHLKRPVKHYTAWRVDGELLKQWEKIGSDEYSQTISPIANRQTLLDKIRNKERVTLSWDIRMLSDSPDPTTASPYIIFTTNRQSAAESAIERIRKHPRLNEYHVKYLVCVTAIDTSASVTSLRCYSGDIALQTVQVQTVGKRQMPI